MAVPPIKLALMGVLVAGAAWMGYTTLFPEQTSVYSEQASHTSEGSVLPEVSASVEIPPSPSSRAMSEPSAEVGNANHADANAPLGAINQALADKIAKLGEAPESVPPLPPLGLDVQTYLSKLSELQLATVDARVREQKLRAQPDNRMTGLGLESAPMVVSPATPPPPSKSSTNSAMMLGSLVQVEDGQWQARLHVHGRWHKVSPGMKLGKVSILSITEQGVRLRDHGKVRWLRMGGQG
ncbi:hypothetical protein [Vibrio hyugaensis]|uniref:hypothetical protein n=1 Tax=Vibrio hyugaensis TaxID=1534743 RepID=UPI0005F01AF7|nr:hypothetical protein [Vibrio hyugaensis]